MKKEINKNIFKLILLSFISFVVFTTNLSVYAEDTPSEQSSSTQTSQATPTPTDSQQKSQDSATVENSSDNKSVQSNQKQDDKTSQQDEINNEDNSQNTNASENESEVDNSKTTPQHKSYSTPANKVEDTNSSESDSTNNDDEDENESKKEDEEKKQKEKEDKEKKQKEEEKAKEDLENKLAQQKENDKKKSTFTPIDASKYGSFSFFQILIYVLIFAIIGFIAFIIYRYVSNGTWNTFFTKLKSKLSKDVVENPYEEHIESNDSKDNITSDLSKITSDTVVIEKDNNINLVSNDVDKSEDNIGRNLNSDPEVFSSNLNNLAKVNNSEEVVYSRTNKEIKATNVSQVNQDQLSISSLLDVANKKEALNPKSDELVEEIYDNLKSNSLEKNVNNLEDIFSNFKFENDFDKTKK